jgi:hypothetical protein
LSLDGDREPDGGYGPAEWAKPTRRLSQHDSSFLRLSIPHRRSGEVRLAGFELRSHVPLYQGRVVPRRQGRVAVSSSDGAVVEVHHTLAESAFVQQFELQADIVGEERVAASHHDGRDEQVDLVDQPGLDRLGGEVGAGVAQSKLPSSSAT